MTISKKIGAFAGKMIKLANTGAEKLENYAEKSAAENNNENAKKLAGAMRKLKENLSQNESEYQKKIEDNAAELLTQGKEALDKVKTLCNKIAKPQTTEDASSLSTKEESPSPAAKTAKKSTSSKTNTSTPPEQ